MSDQSIENLLKKSFSKSSRADWKRIAMQETRDQDPFEVLSWRGRDGIVFSPYYDASDDAKPDSASSTTSPEQDTLSSRGWGSFPAINVANENAANITALDHLAKGADGVLFNLRTAASPDLVALLQQIEWPFCTLLFDLDAHAGIENKLAAFFEHRNFNPASVSGALFWESIPGDNALRYFREHCGNMRSMGYVVPVSAPATEISTALIEGVKKIDECGFPDAAVARAICFSVTANASVPETAAKLKALRMLWAQVMRAYSHTDYNGEDLYIHVRVPGVPDNVYGPHEDMLHATFAAIAAVLGGCNALTLMADAQTPLMLRWMRNVSLILREESFLQSAIDPLAGSYTFDSLTDVIARKAWILFQEKWTRYAKA